MATRSTAHAEEERAIFNALVAAHPSFGAQIKNLAQPEAEFPDVTVEVKNGTFIDFELGEWLDGAQIAAARRYDALAKAMIDALGPQGANPSRHFLAAMLTPRQDAVGLNDADQDAFRTQIWASSATPTDGCMHLSQSSRPSRSIRPTRGARDGRRFLPRLPDHSGEPGQRRPRDTT
jgi:hypothetical protein